MKKILIVTIMLFPFVSQAQLGGLLKKTTDKINNKINDRIEKKTNDVLDKADGKNQKQNNETAAGQDANAQSTASSTGSANANQPMTAYGKYDFVAGEKVIYSNNFSEETMGELPIGWNSNGSAAVVNINGLAGNWVQLYKNAFYLTDNKAFFTENFTIEFDLLLRRSNSKASFAQLGFGVMATGKDNTNDNQIIKEYSKYFAAELKLQPSDYNGSHMHYESFENFNRYLQTDVKRYPSLEKYFNTPIHIAIQVQKERLRMWFNESKMYDLPKAIKPGIMLNQLFFFVKGNGDDEQEVGYDISNIKIAKGIADTRHKLINEGKFSTTGILFDKNAAIIKPESQGTIREIADLLNQFPEIKIKVIGHTDSDGSDADNLELSQKRAEAVKQKLTSEFNINSSRIQSSGKGEADPVSDNKTREGKAQNRRVEFIKI